MKRTISVVLMVLLLLFSLTATAFAASNHAYGHHREVKDRIQINGRHVNFDVPPVIKEGRTLIPVRAITNGLGAEVLWDAKTQTITITRDDTKIVLKLESMEFTVNGVKQVMDVPAQLISNRTFVPLRFIAQALGDRVKYDNATGDIDIYGPLATPERPTLVDFVAKWKAVEHENNGYALRLFRDGIEAKQVTIAHNVALEYSFKSYMEGPGCYTVRVTALATGDYSDSKESRASDPQIVTDADEIVKLEGSIDGLSNAAKEVTIVYSQDGKNLSKTFKVLLSTDIEIDDVDAVFTDLRIGDDVTLTLYKDVLIKLEVDR